MADKSSRESRRFYARSGKSESYTYFGAELDGLLASRDHSQSSFAAEATEKGHKLAQGRITDWIRGRSPCPPWFPPVADEVLALSDEEWVRFALAYTYGQTIPRDRRIRASADGEPTEAPGEIRERREPPEPADISKEGLQSIAEARDYYRYIVDSSEEEGENWENHGSESGSSTSRPT